MNKIKVQLKKSLIGKSFHQKEAVRCLGLKKVHQQKEVPDHPAVWGQLKKVLHLVQYEKLSGSQQPSADQNKTAKQVKQAKPSAKKEIKKERQKTAGKEIKKSKVSERKK